MRDRALVSVHCTVYNHERYIRKCLDSLVAQRTTFRYEILVNDDASTDKSEDIIREYAEQYPDLVVPFYHSENQYSKGKSPIDYLYAHSDSRYVAICEGDDFWTDPDKLQKQVDYMESHPDYSLCVHAAYCAHEDSTLYADKFMRPYEESRTISVEEMIQRWRFATNSILYRRSSRPSVTIPFRGNCANGDYALTTYLALHGKVYYINELMSAYRTESVNSLNWTWRNNKDKSIVAKERFVQMLERLDVYTEHRYTSVIQDVMDRERFHMATVEGDYLTARSYPDRYRQLPVIDRTKLAFRYYCPLLYKGLRYIIRRG